MSDLEGQSPLRLGLWSTRCRGFRLSSLLFTEFRRCRQVNTHKISGAVKPNPQHVGVGGDSQPPADALRNRPLDIPALQQPSGILWRRT